MLWLQGALDTGALLGSPTPMWTVHPPNESQAPQTRVIMNLKTLSRSTNADTGSKNRMAVGGAGAGVAAEAEVEVTTGNTGEEETAGIDIGNRIETEKDTMTSDPEDDVRFRLRGRITSARGPRGTVGKKHLSIARETHIDPLIVRNEKDTGDMTTEDAMTERDKEQGFPLWNIINSYADRVKHQKHHFPSP